MSPSPRSGRLPFITHLEALKSHYGLERFCKSESNELYAGRAVVLKRTTLSRGNAADVRWHSHELKCLLLADALRIYLNAPGLVQLEQVHLDIERELQPRMYWSMVLERFQGNLETCPLFNGEESEESVLGAAAQLLLLLVQLGSIELCNNDAYARNIVWRRTSEQRILYYSDGHCRYAVPTHGFQFALVDFGVGSTSSEAPEVQQCSARLKHPMAQHVLTVRGFPAYARDLSAVLHSLSSCTQSSWLAATNQRLNETLHSKPQRRELKRPKGLFAFVQRVLAPEFLAQHGVDAAALSLRHAFSDASVWRTELDVRERETFNVLLAAADRRHEQYCRAAARCVELSS